MEKDIQHLNIDDTKYETEIPDSNISKRKKEDGDSREVRAIIPGVIVEVKVRKGQKVTAGDVVIVLEAMKMYNDIEALIDGIITEILVSKGDKVAKDQLMIRMA